MSNAEDRPQPAPDSSSDVPAEIRQRFTPEEIQILAIVARGEGWEWTERHAHLVLDQARMIGEL